MPVPSVLDLLLPERCVLCGRTATPLCAPCAATLPPAPDLRPPPGFEECCSLLSYEGPAKQVVAALKYRGHRDAVRVLGAAMAELVGIGVDVVTWAPTSATRRRERGFDQAELLARQVGGSLGVRCAALLGRTTEAGQVGRSRAERVDGAAFAPRRRCAGTVLVVDDVRTTGATLAAAGDALLDAGAAAVAGVTLAATP